MKITRFEDLLVWQRARELSLAVYRATSSGLFARDFGLRDQIRRAAVSVMSNIAEGFGRYTLPEIRRFITIAKGSASEVRSQLYLARDLGYVSESDHQALSALCVEVDRMLARYRASLDVPSPPPSSRVPRPKP
ncbi:MAG: four helix bundle protein [Gemmatimonadetes bacterium]|nr:four helix bundle protein [Gemmatimonadota bacterium]